MRNKNILDRLKAAFRRVLYRRPGFYAECCCGLRGPKYVCGLDRYNMLDPMDFYHCVELSGGFGCSQCSKFARGCWGPRLRAY